jgi:DNA (cytosine-5)-methyltransferase 1
MQENTMKPTFGSLFAGVGGFDMGMEDAGWECKFQVEWDKHCQHILNKHWPDIPKWGDVSTVSGTEIPPVDCIIFGSPCQDLSVAGKRAGLQGERSGLFYEAVRIIKEMRHVTNGTFPRWAIWENVAGALSSNNGRDFAAVISEMAEAGAVLQEYALLDAQHFGIPQRRRRVFLVACFDPAIARNCPDPLLPVSESLRGNTQKGKSKGKVASRTLTEGVTDDGAIVNAIGASIYHKSTVVNQDVNSGHLVVGSLAARDYKGVGSQYVDEGKVIVEPFVKSRRAQSASDVETWVEGQVNPTLNSFDMGDTRATTTIVEPVLFENSYRDGARIAKDGVTQTLSAKMGTGGGNTPMIATAYSVREDAKANTFSATELDHANALSALRPSPQSHHAQMFIAEPQMAVRRLTPLECERLMGWPDDHTRWKADGTEQADTHRYKQCGNGVASPVAKWIAQHILKAHQ